MLRAVPVCQSGQCGWLLHSLCRCALLRTDVRRPASGGPPLQASSLFIDLPWWVCDLVGM